MKAKITFILTFTLFSCQRLTDALFDAAQPEQQTELKYIPAKLIGNYESLIDSAYLTITEKEIIIKNIYNLNVSNAELDSTERINLRDTVYRERKGSITVKVTADSVFQRTLSLDTLYYHSDKYVIKKSNGYYFCNQRLSDKWLVRTLRMVDNGILISKPKSNENIKALADYSLLEPDSITHKIPSMDELQRFLTDERYKDEWMFVKVEYGLQRKL